VLRHQFGQNLILGLDLLGQILDPLLLGLLVGAHPGLERGCPILEELLLLPVEDRGLEPHLIAELRNRLLLQQMPPQDGDFLFRCVMLSALFHAFSPLSLTVERSLSISN